MGRFAGRLARSSAGTRSLPYLRTRARRPGSVVGVVAMVVVALSVTLNPLPASALSSTPWTGTGPAGVVDSDGLTSPAQFSYDMPNAGLGTVRTWTFSTTAAAAAQLVVPYHYTGLHQFFEVTVTLTAFVTNGTGTRQTKLVDEGPTDCCTQPSGGFTFDGAVALDVQPGDTYGFVMSGSNRDAVDTLSGTLTVPETLPAAPYADPAQVADNTSWPNAALLNSAGAGGAITAPGQARWYKFPITPSSQVQVTLANLAENYDLTLYDDIGAAFQRLASPSSTTDLNTLDAEQAGNAFSPSIYSPSIYSPSIYSPSIYSPSIYSPSIYSPSIYSPSIYSPSIYSPSIYSPSIYSPSIYSPSTFSPSIYSPSDAFVQAFSDAQTRSLIGISAQDGTAPEAISSATWNNTGYFYVRVLGRNGVDSSTPFHLGLATSGGPCSGITLDSYAGDSTLAGTPGTATTVIVTDSARLAPTPALTADLGHLATATHGVVVDVSHSQRVVDLNRQADANAGCAYAKNLVAQAIREIVNSYRDANATLKYVAIIGGDGVIPFFRYPDQAGIGPENNYNPPVLGSSASQASLQTNDVLGQDGYGTVSDLTLKGSVLPVPDLAVGRLVETVPEIDGQLTQFLGLTAQTLPTPRSSLVTGYDFLTGAADTVESDLSQGLGAGARNDQLVTDQGVPTTTTTPPSGPSRTTSWTATDLAKALFTSRHDIVFLAGHFSANNTLAADYSSTLATTDVAAHPGQFTNSLVFSAGCHSGYNLVDQDGVPGLTLGLDWAQEMAQQRAILVAGTGYQYADTNFLAYSAQLYTMFAHELRAGTPGTGTGIGPALVRAKQDYLAGLATVGGIDQKTIIEATLYGLPMTLINLPGARTGVPGGGPAVTPEPVTPGTPGATLRLRSADVGLDIVSAAHSAPILGVNGNPTGSGYTWLTGPDGTTNAPALPVLPKQIVNVTPLGQFALRGVGLRSGTYTDTPGITPLTGAPATEQNGIHTSFASPQFFPQTLATPNYFRAMSAGGAPPRTTLIVNPVQYRADAPGSTTDVQRSYSHLGLTLFYSGNTTTYGANTPALAAPPSISGVSSAVSADHASVDVSAHVTGDPSAGIQAVWLTYTGESGPAHGTWASLDLTQDASDSTLWTGTLVLPPGQDPNAVRFMLQAANGVGVVGLDDNLGALYSPGVPVGSVPPGAAATALYLDPVPSSVAYGSTMTLGATLVGAPAGSPVTFDIGSAQVFGTTDSAGHASGAVPVFGGLGSHVVTAVYAGDATHAPSSDQSSFNEVKAGTWLVIGGTGMRFWPAASGPAGGSPVPIDTRLFATLTTSTGQALPQKSVLFTIRRAGTPHSVLLVVRTTDLNGVAKLGTLSLAPGEYTVSASFGATVIGSIPDPVYAASTARPWHVLFLRRSAPIRTG